MALGRLRGQEIDGHTSFPGPGAADSVARVIIVRRAIDSGGGQTAVPQDVSHLAATCQAQLTGSTYWAGSKGRARACSYQVTNWRRSGHVATPRSIGWSGAGGPPPPGEGE